MLRTNCPVLFSTTVSLNDRGTEESVYRKGYSAVSKEFEDLLGVIMHGDSVVIL